MNTLFEQSVCNYEIQGDYQLPCIATKKQNELHIGVWANRHRQYLKQHHRAFRTMKVADRCNDISA